MQKLIGLGTMLISLAGCVTATPNLTKEEMTIQQIVETPGQTKDQLFEKSKIWLARTFKSSKQILEYENKPDGKIIGNGMISRVPFGPFQLGLGQTISFTLQEDIRDNRVRLSFDNLVIHVPANNSQYSFHPVATESRISEKDLFEETKAELVLLANSLGTFLNSKNDGDRW